MPKVHAIGRTSEGRSGGDGMVKRHFSWAALVGKGRKSMSRRIARLFYGALMAGAAMVAALPLPASAQTTYQLVWPHADGHLTCFGYQGTFLQDPHHPTVMLVQWYGEATDECFGIARDRSIWHTWIGAGGWRKMTGRADYPTAAYTKSYNPYTRAIHVCVMGSGIWENDDVDSTWEGWWLFDPGAC
jgi:hypothetical protein